MMKTAAVLLALLIPAAALAEDNPALPSYATAPAGTVLANPNPWADNAVPVAQTYAQVGHLALIKGASMTSTSDQPFDMLTLPAEYEITAIYAVNCSATPAGAVGGIYTASAKGGTQIVAASQTYTALTSATTIEQLTNNVSTAAQTATQFYLSLGTAASAGSPTCDIYIDGIGLQ